MPPPSLRVRLTLWYTGVLLLMLSAFGTVVLWQQSRIGLRRVDRELSSLSMTLANVVRDELREEPNPPAIAQEICDTFADPRRAVALLDSGGGVLGAHWGSLAPADLSHLAALSSRQGAATTLAAWRVHARRERFGATEMILVVGTPAIELTRERREAAEAMVVGIPLGLLIAAAGGLWLATIGLAPIDAMIERLAASLRTQRQFMADASHELRTPVSVVRTAAEVALSRDRREEQEYRETLSIVGGQARHLGHLVDDMLTLARADADGPLLRRVDLYLDDVIDECRRTVNVLATERGVRIRTSAAQEIAYRGDEALLRQLVTNVLQNAVQHTPPGGEVNIEAARQPGNVTIRITDAGQGIAPADQQRIFDRFVQLDPARRLQGSGLGLPIARWIAEAHQGTLVLERSGPCGSTFCVSLPV